LSIRADKFYNAPDTEIDVTEQGGLMWGEYAVGRLMAGSDALNPQVHPFVDEDVDPQVAEKVRRRLGHWLDRKIAALFQPLIALRDDEALTGMARGIAFRLVEALGVVPRNEIADDVKALDQDGRASLRKHGVRFGQHTVFQPLLLKPAPTRLRLILWSLASGFEVFPEAPPPGLVTLPAVQDAPPGYYPRAGYRLAGERAIRIDMLERLADMIRPLDSRAGFEASPEMLSITGLSLDQFAKLMQGMGYQATEATRPRRKPLPAAPAIVAAATPAAPAAGNLAAADVAGEPEPDVPQPEVPVPADPDIQPPQPTEVPPQEPDVPSPEPPGVPFDEPVEIPTPDPQISTSTEAAESAPEMETYYLFVRAPRRRPEPDRPERKRDARPKGKPRHSAEGGRPPRGVDEDQRKGKREGKGREAKPPHARPPRPEKPIDPDNPFAALMALKTRG
jgi:ATP-dependent RNA helicase SUPV3L1/SUV3